MSQRSPPDSILQNVTIRRPRRSPLRLSDTSLVRRCGRTCRMDSVRPCSKERQRQRVSTLESIGRIRKKMAFHSNTCGTVSDSCLLRAEAGDSAQQSISDLRNQIYLREDRKGRSSFTEVRSSSNTSIRNGERGEARRLLEMYPASPNRVEDRFSAKQKYP